MLIEHYPNPVLQRFFVQDVWEINSQYETANTVYQCISTIRKVFTSMSFNGNIIKTMPRKGLTLSPSVSFEAIHSNIIMEVNI
ncbi:winged helix-turn-helix domain-containing protein [Serratia sp. T13T92]|uniref:winged helix-turn-helix domain-containing protein n=1 Tax=Serratia sp. T13T92 TaxID=3397496 RepID=UPI0039E1735A